MTVKGCKGCKKGGKFTVLMTLLWAFTAVKTLYWLLLYKMAVNGTTTFSITILSLMILGIITFTSMTPSIYNIHHNNTLPLCRVPLYRVLRFICCYTECRYADCRYAEYRYAECHLLSVVVPIKCPISRVFTNNCKIQVTSKCCLSLPSTHTSWTNKPPKLWLTHKLDGAVTFSITTSSTMTLSITTLSIMAFIYNTSSITIVPANFPISAR